MPQGELRLTGRAWGVITSHAQACLPEEACGLLGGRGLTAWRAVPVENAEHSPIRYRMEPQAQIEAMLGLEQAGEELVGIFHSHPAGPAGLSDTDIAEARYPECVYLVLSRDGSAWSGRAHRIGGGMVLPVALVIDEATSDVG